MADQPFDLDAAIGKMRAAGVPWDQVNAALTMKHDEMAKAGVPEQTIREAMGFNRPGPHMADFQAYLEAQQRSFNDANVNKPPEYTTLQSFLGGLSQSSAAEQARRFASGGKASAGSFADATSDGLFGHFARMAGQMVGDVPLFSSTFAATEAAAAPTAGAVGAAGGPLGEGLAQIGALAVSTGTAFAAVDAFHKEYAQEIKGGAWTAGNAIQRAGEIAATASKSFVTGAVMSPAGVLARTGVASLGAGKVTQGLAQLAAENATQVGVTAGLNGQLPTKEDWIDGAVMVALLHAGQVSSASLKYSREALADHWQKTGQNPLEAARQAMTDPLFRQRLLNPKQPIDRDASFHDDTDGDTAAIKSPGPDLKAVARSVGIKSSPADDQVEYAIHKTEGGLGPGGVARVSPAGAIGEWQIMPATAKHYMGPEFDTNLLFDPKWNNVVHEKIMDDLRRRFPGDAGAQIAAYNAGIGRGEQLQKAGPGTMLREVLDKTAPGGKRWETVSAARDESFLPMETQRYLAHTRRILGQDVLHGQPTEVDAEGKPVPPPTREPDEPVVEDFDEFRVKSQSPTEPEFRDLGTTLHYELSPNPADPERMARWDALTDEQKRTATDVIGRGAEAQIAEHLGIDTSGRSQEGGWYDRTSASRGFSISDPAQADRAAEIIRYAFRQEAVAASGGSEREGSEPRDVIRVTSPETATRAGVAALWTRVQKELNPEGYEDWGKIASPGHTTELNRAMEITLEAGVDPEAALAAVHRALSEGETAELGKTHFKLHFEGQELSAEDKAFADKLRTEIDQRMEDVASVANGGMGISGKITGPKHTSQPSGAPSGMDYAKLWEAAGKPSDDPWAAVGGRMVKDPQPSILGRLTDWARGVFLDLFDPNAPSKRFVNAVLNSGVKLDPKDNPNYAHRLAEIGKSSLPMYMIDQGMIDTEGNRVGKSLREILSPFEGNKVAVERFRRYSLAKWAVEKALQGKQTGVPLADALAIVQEVESQGIVPPGIDWRTGAQMFGVPVKVHKESSGIMQLIGPHYSHKDQAIHLSDADEETTVTRYGRGLTPDVIAAHELGHAIAFKWGQAVGKGDWSHLPEKEADNLRDELTIVSRRFKPGLWDDFSQRQHVTKTSELMADAIATWMTDPVARTHMPVFERLMQTYRDKNMPFGDLGEKPEKWGTPEQQAFQELQDWQNSTLRYMKDAGVISRDQYINWVAENAARIPGYRVDDESFGSNGRPRAGKSVYQPVKAFNGSDLPVAEMIKSLMQDAFTRTQVSLENMALQNELKLHMAIGDVESAPGVPVRFNLSPAELKAAGIGSDANGMVKVWRVLPGLGANEVPIFFNGEGHRYIFKDPELTNLLKGYDKYALGRLDQAAAWFTKYTRGLIVNNPAFSIRTSVYDVLFQGIVHPDGIKTAGEYTSGLAVGVGRLFGDETASALYDEWIRSGGAARVFDQLSKDRFIEARLKNYDPTIADMAWNTVSTPLRGLKLWANLLTQSQQLGRFKRLRDQGVDLQEAGVRASEAAFHAGGSGPWISRVDAAVPFMGAYFRGLEKTTRALLGGAIKDNLTLTGEKYSAVQTFTKGLALLTATSLAQWAQNKDKPWYKSAPTWQKDNGWLFHFGDDEHGTTLFVKAPPILSVLFIGLPRRLAEAFFADNPDAWHEFGQSIADTFLPSGFFTYNVLLPVIEHMANHSFFRDRPLVTDDDKNGRLTQDQGVEWSTDTAKGISRFVNDLPLLKDAKLSPPVIDNYIQGWGGSIGAAAVEAADRITEGDKKPAQDWTEWPLVRSFFARYPGYSAEPVKEFQDAVTKFDQVHGSLMSAMRAHDMARFKEIVEQNPTAAMAHALKFQQEPFDQEDLGPYMEALSAASTNANMADAQLIVQADTSITRLHTYMRAIQGADPKSLSPTDKRQLMDQALGIQQVVSERALRVMHDAGINGERPDPEAQVALQDALDKMQELQAQGMSR